MLTSMHASMQSWCKLRLDIGLFFIVPLLSLSTLKGFLDSSYRRKRYRKSLLTYVFSSVYVDYYKALYFAQIPIS